MNAERRSEFAALMWAAFIVFAILRIAGEVQWSWWLVTAPLWAPPLTLAAVVLALLVVCVPGATVASIVTRRGRRARQRSVQRILRETGRSSEL